MVPPNLELGFKYTRLPGFVKRFHKIFAVDAFAGENTNNTKRPGEKVHKTA